MKPRMRLTALTIAVLGTTLAVPAESKPLIGQAGRGVVAPAGFASTVWAEAPIVATTLTWGPDTGDAAIVANAQRYLHGTLLYVGGVAGNPVACEGCGQVVAFNDERQLVTPMAAEGSVAVADGFNAVLGIAFGPDETMYVADNIATPAPRGRVVAAKDTDGDGYFETKRVVLKNIPNGRHQTNGLSFGPDGMIYLANGNATDDGIECGPDTDPDTREDPVCPDPERRPWTGSIIRVNPAWDNVDLLTDVRVDSDIRYAPDGLDDESVLVAQGFRNIYDVDFNPARANEVWTPMNGPDNPSGSEPIYGLPIDDEFQIQVGTDPETGQPIFEDSPIIEDAGFPSCVYDPHWNEFPRPQIGGHEHPGQPDPQNNLNDAVIAQFGSCESKKASVLRPRAVLKEGHEGTSGLAFERGGNFPARYDGDLFIAEWGSIWNLNGGKPNGHKVLRLNVNPDGTVSGMQQEFFTSPLPMDVTFGANGYMYVADMTGQIYEIRFVADAVGEEVVVEIAEPTEGRVQFVPQSVPVVRGQKVTWVNNTDSPQRIVCRQRVYPQEPNPSDLQATPIVLCGEINSPLIPAGGRYSHTFEDFPSVYHYAASDAANEAATGTVVLSPVER